MYNYYGTKDLKGFLLTQDFNGKELILFIANLSNKEYFSEGERAAGLIENNDSLMRPMIYDNILDEFEDFEKIDKSVFTNIFYKWFILYAGINSVKTPYINSVMRTWSIYN